MPQHITWAVILFIHWKGKPRPRDGQQVPSDHKGRMEWIGIWTKQASSHLNAKSPKGQMLTLLIAMFWNILSQVSFIIQRMMWLKRMPSKSCLAMN